LAEVIIMMCRITVEELRYCLTEKKSGRKTGRFCALAGWQYNGQAIHEIEIGKYGVVRYYNNGALIAKFDDCDAFLDD
jgi:hypothetical protein